MTFHAVGDKLRDVEMSYLFGHKLLSVGLLGAENSSMKHKCRIFSLQYICPIIDLMPSQLTASNSSNLIFSVITNVGAGDSRYASFHYPRFRTSAMSRLGMLFQERNPRV